MTNPIIGITVNPCLQDVDVQVRWQEVEEQRHRWILLMSHSPSANFIVRGFERDCCIASISQLTSYWKELIGAAAIEAK